MNYTFYTACYTFTVYLLLLWSLQICGASIFGLGIYLMTTSKFAALLPSLQAMSIANSLFITGIIITCVSFLGFLGALKENRCLLISVSHMQNVCHLHESAYCLKSTIFFVFLFVGLVLHFAVHSDAGRVGCCMCSAHIWGTGIQHSLMQMELNLENLSKQRNVCFSVCPGWQIHHWRS